jgi:hypothetical protein
MVLVVLIAIWIYVIVEQVGYFPGLVPCVCESIPFLGALVLTPILVVFLREFVCFCLWIIVVLQCCLYNFLISFLVPSVD